MKFIADFHVHSKYSRATSKDMNLENMAKWARIKGIKVLTTGDFTHPEWFKNLEEKLEPAEPGLYRLKTEPENEVRFILTTEISCIYSKNDKVRKIHIVVFAPDLAVVEKINTKLGLIGNLKADGRPILGLDAKELAKIILNVSKDCLIVPAHIMTPWFGIFGSKSGFDSLEECFEDYSKYIYAVETGLSADPAMIWRLPNMDKITLISNSDAHSMAKLGREANVFEGDELSYKDITTAIKIGGGRASPDLAIKIGGGRASPDLADGSLKLAYTIEFYPQEGKYYYDGHRNCGVCLGPKESKKYNNVCPTCGRLLTIGVLNRIEQLAVKEEGFKPKGAIPFKSLVPLKEIAAEVLGVGVGTKQVDKEYQSLIREFNNEFKILLDISDKDLKAVTLPEIAEGIIRVRQGKVFVESGYDGVFGKVRIFGKGEQKKSSAQKTLF